MHPQQQGANQYLDCELDQLIPKRRLDAQDLAAYTGGRAMPVTIEGVTWQSFEAKKDGRGQQKDEIVYELHVREFKKPIKMTTTRLQTLGDELGTRKLREWTGRVVLIEPCSSWITDRETGRRKRIWTIEIAGVAAAALPGIQPKMDITGMFGEAARAGQVANLLTADPMTQTPGAGGAALPPGAAPARGLMNAMTAPPQHTPPAGGAASPPGGAPAWQPPRPWPVTPAGLIGGEIGITIASELHRRNLTTAQAVQYLQQVAPMLVQYCTGAEIHAWPDAARPWLKKLCADKPMTKPAFTDTDRRNLFDHWFPAAAVGEVINRETGEVTPTPATVDEDDIPF